MKYHLSVLAAILMVVFSLPILAAAATLSSAVVQTPTSQCVNGAPQITIKWSAPSVAVSYSIFRNKSSTKWLNVSSKQTSTTFTNKSVSSGLSYQYQAKTYFATGATFSNIVSIVAPTCASTSSP